MSDKKGKAKPPLIFISSSEEEDETEEEDGDDDDYEDRSFSSSRHFNSYFIFNLFGFSPFNIDLILISSVEMKLRGRKRKRKGTIRTIMIGPRKANLSAMELLLFSKVIFAFFEFINFLFLKISIVFDPKKKSLQFMILVFHRRR